MNPKPDLDLERISEKVFAWTLHFFSHKGDRR